MMQITRKGIEHLRDEAYKQLEKLNAAEKRIQQAKSAILDTIKQFNEDIRNWEDT